MPHRHHVVVLVSAALLAGCGKAVTTGPSQSEAPSRSSFNVYTHCGVESARIEGRWWHADPALYNDDKTGPPAGWGNPYQPGTLTMESSDRAVFEALGERVAFVPAPDDKPVRVCR